MIAFVCGSPVQVMRALHMKMRYDICSDDADIYILHKCAGYEKLAVKIEKLNIFKSVYATNVSELGKRIVLKLLIGNNKYAKLIRAKKYIKLFTFNIEDELAQAIFCINKNINGFEHHCVEDGPNIYQIYEPPKYKWYHPFRWFGLDKQAYHITTWWTSCPEFIKLPKSFHTQKYKLMPIDCTDKEYKEAVNFVFEYEPSDALENADILIMDESHYTDGLMIDDADINIYKRIRTHYPDFNILIKMHPRTKHNRYVDDFEIMENSTIPWELYVLNREYNKKKDLIQISIVCGTMLSDLFMFGIEGKKIILAPLFYDKVKVPKNGTPRVSRFETENYEKVKRLYKKPENFRIAYNENDIFEALNDMLEIKN